MLTHHTHNTHVVIRIVERAGNQFEARVGGQIICVSRQPFLDAARSLVELGYPDDTVIVMRHDGSTTDSLRAKLAIAAKWTIEERDNRRLRLVRWRPRDVTEGSPPVAFRALGIGQGQEGIAP